jgi:hypothetical protein
MLMHFYRIERKAYYTNRELSRLEPNKHLCIIIDGMDQQKTCLPFMVPESKTTQTLPRITAHITGVLVHTQIDGGKLAFAYTDIHQWPHDSNLTLNVLNETLEYMRQR